jgi:hypothetical protein
MANLNIEIPYQAFEVVRTRIWEILKDELHNQAVVSGDYELEPSVEIESTNPYIDKEEVPIVSVSLANGKYSNKHQGSSTGSYQYFIDVFTNSKIKENAPGDYLASVKMQRLLGLCRYILEDPVYKTLAFTPPFISRVFVSTIDIAANPQKDDTRFNSMGRLTLDVTVNEQNDLKVPPSIQGYDTNATIGNTGIGYTYSGNTYP